MPYIAWKDRPKYVPIIEDALKVISLSGDAFDQIDHMGYFVWSVFYVLDRQGDYTLTICNPFLSVCLNKEILYSLNKQIDLATDILLHQDLATAAGDLNFLTSSVVWGALGDSHLFPSAKYAVRAYARSTLLMVQSMLGSLMPAKVEKWRPTMMWRGVIRDVIAELYRRRTSVYENKKITENGDVWPLPQVVPQEA